jgi:hypothetical protein
MEERWTTTYVLPTMIAPNADGSVPQITWGSILAWTGSRCYSRLVRPGFAEGGADIRMQDETARVEDALLDRDATAAIMNCFVQSSGSHLEKVIDRYVPISQ